MCNPWSSGKGRTQEDFNLLLLLYPLNFVRVLTKTTNSFKLVIFGVRRDAINNWAVGVNWDVRAHYDWAIFACISWKGPWHGRAQVIFSLKTGFSVIWTLSTVKAVGYRRFPNIQSLTELSPYCHLHRSPLWEDYGFLERRDCAVSMT